MTHWIQQLLWHSLAMSILTAAYGGAVALLRRRCAARWFYLAGVVLLLGFLIPFRPVLTLSPGSAPAALAGIVRQAGPAQGVVTTPAPQTATASPWPIVFALWLAGTLATLACHGLRHLRFVRAARRWYAPVYDIRLRAQFEAAAQSLGLDPRRIGLAQCACIGSPMLVWLSRPTIMLPENTPATDASRLFLLHELTHLRRRDLLFRLLVLLTTAMHWFNPMVYVLARLTTLQCEISCDACVVTGEDIEGRHLYALSILDIAQRQARQYTLLTTHFYGGKNNMKKRITSIYTPGNTRFGALFLVCALLITALAGTSIAAAPEAIDITLPDHPGVKAHEALDSYVVAWAPVEGAVEYHLGVYVKLLSKGGAEYWAVTDGWVGNLSFTDADGTIHTVENGVWEAIELDGDATSADISGIYNKHMEREYAGDIASFEECHLVVVAVREVGAPLKVDMLIPVR